MTVLTRIGIGGVALLAVSLGGWAPWTRTEQPSALHAQVEEDDSFVAALPTWLRTVQGGPGWQAGEDYSGYRLVILDRGFEHASTAVYLQWLRTNDEARGVEVMHSVRLTEIGSAVWSTSDGTFCNRPDGSLELLIPATHVYTLEDTTFRFQIGAPGQYQPLEAPTAGTVGDCGA